MTRCPRCGAPEREDTTFAKDCAMYGVKRQAFRCLNGHARYVGEPPPKRQEPPAGRCCNICGDPIEPGPGEPPSLARRRRRCRVCAVKGGNDG